MEWFGSMHDRWFVAAGAEPTRGARCTITRLQGTNEPPGPHTIRCGFWSLTHKNAFECAVTYSNASDLLVPARLSD
jgi:hypothetical protein